MEQMAASIPTDGSGMDDAAAGFVHRVKLLVSRRSPSKESIAPYQELIISSKVLRRSVNCLRFAVFVDAIAGTIERPNYRKFVLLLMPFGYAQHSHIFIHKTAIMVLPRGSPGSHQDSFETTEPFGFSAATYFVPMSALLGGEPNR